MFCINCLVKTKNPKFCSRSCAAIFNNKTFHKRKPKIIICFRCNNQLKPRKRICDICSPKINWNETTYAQVKGLRKYQKHSRIRDLARKTYIKSEHPKCCSNCGYNKHFEVCHIKPISSFPDSAFITEINHIENLIALCPNCHWEFDKGLLDISTTGRTRTCI